MPESPALTGLERWRRDTSMSYWSPGHFETCGQISFASALWFLQFEWCWSRINRVRNKIRFYYTLHKDRKTKPMRFESLIETCTYPFLDVYKKKNHKKMSLYICLEYLIPILLIFGNIWYWLKMKYFLFDMILNFCIYLKLYMALNEQVLL